MENGFTHFDTDGNAIMVDISKKDITQRYATASGEITVCNKIMQSILEGSLKKGDVLGVARIAGIMATKKTADIIPLCHPLSLNKCSIDFKIDKNTNTIKTLCSVTTDGKTGVEMEALTGVSATLLTIYDMCKAIDKSMHIENIHLVKKEGGKSGVFHA